MEARRLMGLVGATNAAGNEEKSDIIHNASVSEAARMHIGKVRVEGIIISISPLRKLLREQVYWCPKCETLIRVPGMNAILGKPDIYTYTRQPKKCTTKDCECTVFMGRHEYTNAIIIEIRDPDTFSDIDPLKAVLFDNDTIDIYPHLGEKVTVTGTLRVITIPPKNNSVSYLYAESIHYESNEEVIISPQDRAAIERFTKSKGDDIIDSLGEMFAPDVIGYNYVKKGMLLVAASTNNDINQKKLHALLIGDPGLAKSALLRKSTKLVLNSRFESAQNSSGKSLTAIGEGRRFSYPKNGSCPSS
jgi:DNA replicative helicase MCM subunit Mcm2 (Cdc46/Mcm family)